MTSYETDVKAQLQNWENKMQQRPSLMDKLTKKLQVKMNSLIPEKVHKGITTTIKQMIRAVLFGAKFVTKNAVKSMNFETREIVAEEKISFYQKTAATEGGLTGAGGILLGLADFPLLLGIKLKLLFDLAAVYGYDVKDYKERLYILYIFQLAFCSR